MALTKNQAKRSIATSAVVSASRRTDIPAFYGSWFRNRLEEGFAGYVNPFGGQRHLVSLKPGALRAFLFWSKNAIPFEASLEDVEQRGFGWVLQYTLTGLPRDFEPGVPPLEDRIASFERIGGRFGPKRVVWRFDPLVFWEGMVPSFHKERFSRIAAALEGRTDICIVSFADLYGKVQRSFERLRRDKGIAIREPSRSERLDVCGDLADMARQHGMALQACCEPDLVEGGSSQAHCLDRGRFANLFGIDQKEMPSRPTRKGCGCAQSRDIGAYDTCPHGCAYCYANVNKEKAQARHATHDPWSPFLGVDGATARKWVEEIVGPG